MDRRSYFVLFKKCNEEGCACGGISNSNALQYLMKFNLTPMHPPHSSDHFLTFLEASSEMERGRKCTPADQHCPSLHQKTSPEPRCTKGCDYVFQSKADYDLHNMLCHYSLNTKKASNDKVPKKIRCTYPVGDTVCGAEFPTMYQLGVHKTNEGHKMRQGRKRQMNVNMK